MPNELNRQMPFSLQAEQSVLGSVLIDPEKFNEVATALSESDFYLDIHKRIFNAMATLSLSQNRQIDPVTLTNAMVERGDMDEAACRNNIMAIVNTTPTTANLRDYVNIVKEKSLRRQLIDASSEISEMAFNE